MPVSDVPVQVLDLWLTLIPLAQASLGCRTAAFALASTAKLTRITDDRIGNDCGERTRIRHEQGCYSSMQNGFGFYFDVIECKMWDLILS